MTASAYHLFAELYTRRNSLRSGGIDPEQFTLRDDLIACRGGRAMFPDMVLRTNTSDPLFTGGELVEIKNSKSYTIPSFNSTIPTAIKHIRDHVTANGKMERAMRNAGENPDALPVREVYYLIRGRDNDRCKICLVCGGFFETISEQENISHATGTAVERAIADSGRDDDAALRQATEAVLDLNFKREHFAEAKQHEQASVSVRMRIMTEAVPEANLLNAAYYPEIGDDTLNMVVAAGDAQEYDANRQHAEQKMLAAFGGNWPADLTTTRLDHLRNGPFVLFQTRLNLVALA